MLTKSFWHSTAKWSLGRCKVGTQLGDYWKVIFPNYISG